MYRDVCGFARVLQQNVFDSIVDLRDSSPSTCVPREEIEMKCKEWEMAAYFETSAMHNTGLFDLMKSCVCMID